MVFKAFEGKAPDGADFMTGHDSWSATYKDPEFWRWLLAQRRERHRGA